MRSQEYETRQPEPVTDEVIRKLRAAVSRAKRIDIDTHQQIGMGPSGTGTVPVRWATLETLLDALEHESEKVLPETHPVRTANPRFSAS